MDCLYRGSVEFQIVTMIGKGLQLLVLPVVANADDWCLGHLYDLYQSSYTTSVSSPYSVYFVHNDDTLLGIDSPQGSSDWVVVLLHFLETSHTEVI